LLRVFCETQKGERVDLFNLGENAATEPSGFLSSEIARIDMSALLKEWNLAMS
jgi:hypothetical protein